jgi:hypothetical protein
MTALEQLGLFVGQDVPGLDVAVDDGHHHETDQDVMRERLAAMGCRVTRRRHQAVGLAERPAALPPRDPVAAAALWRRATAWFWRERLTAG